MKKIILLLGLLIFALLGYSQDEGENLNIDNAKLNNRLYGDKSGGIDTLIVPDTDSLGQYKYMNMLDPANDLDGVNRRTLVDTVDKYAFVEPRDSILFNKDISDLIHQEAKFYYDSTKQSFVGYIGETDVTFEFMYEDWIRVYNNSGVTIENGRVGYLTGIVLDANNTVTVSLAQSDSAATCLSTLGVATHDIEPDSYGVLTRSGTVRDVNTPLFGFSTSGELGYLSSTTPGLITPSPPPSPNYLIRLGNVGKIDASTGTFEVHIDIGGNTVSVIKIFNGATLENTTVDVFSDGIADTVSIEADGGGDLSLFFNGVFSVFDATPAAKIAITPGTDTIPVRNWVYIPESTRELTVNTTSVSVVNGFPINQQYVPIVDVITPSAATAQARGFNKVHVWTDHLSNSVDQGHMSDVNFWIRKQPATYLSGFALTTDPLEDIFNDSISITTGSGTALQLHPHGCDAQSTTTGDSLKVYNDPDFSNRPIQNLNSIDLNQDSEGVSLTNQYYTVTIWSVISEDTEDCQLFLNLPSGSYNNASSALLDASEFRNTRIPTEYKGAAILLYSLTLQNSGTDIKIVTDGIEDLREDAPPPGGAGGPGGITSYDELNDTPPNKIGSSNKLVGVDLGEVNLVYKEVEVDGSGNTTVAGWLLTDSLSVTNGATIGGDLNVTGTGTFGDITSSSKILANSTSFEDHFEVNRSGSGGLITAGSNQFIFKPVGSTTIMAINGMDLVLTGGITIGTQAVNGDEVPDLDQVNALIADVWTDAGTELYPTNNENIRVGDGSNTGDKYIYLQRGTLADGFIDTRLLNSGGNFSISTGQTSVWTNRFEIDALTGQQTWASYTGTGSHSGTAAANLQVDASGNVITTVVPGGGGGDVTKVGTPVNEQVGIWTGDGTLAGYDSYTFNKSLTDPELKLFSSSATGASGVTFYDQTDTQQFSVGYDNNSDQSVLLSSQTILFGSGLNQMTLSSSEFDVQGDINVGGYFKDASGDVGTSGQILSSTVTGTNWIDNTSGLWTDGGTFVYPTNGETVRSSSSTPAFELYDSDSDDFKISGDGDFVSIINVTAAQGLFNLSNTGVIDLPAYGGGAVTGTAAYNLEVTSGGLVIETAAGSDFRKKENFRLLNNSLDKIISLNTYAFDWKKDIPKQARETTMNIEVQSDLNERESAGVIAQEIQKIIPEAVKQYNNGYYKVDYEVIVPHLIEAIKEQQKQIDELKTLINKK